MGSGTQGLSPGGLTAGPGVIGAGQWSTVGGAHKGGQDEVGSGLGSLCLNSVLTGLLVYYPRMLLSLGPASPQKPARQNTEIQHTAGALAPDWRTAAVRSSLTISGTCRSGGPWLVPGPAFAAQVFLRVSQAPRSRPG